MNVGSNNQGASTNAIALSGLQGASERLDAAARSVQESLSDGRPPPPGAAAPSTVGTSSSAVQLTLSGRGADLPGALIEMIKAEAETKANVAVLKTENQMQGELLSIVG